VYPHIAELLLAVRESLGIDARAMRFFVAHSAIDTRHAEQVRAALRSAVTTPELGRAVERVAVTSLWLTIELLEQVFEAHAKAEASS
jgi:pyrroloquinoline quinone (PQQ) biosynthesis protein C